MTPEFPGGTYAYFVSIEADGTPKFPYNIGRTYFGTPSANTADAIPAGATIAFQGGPEKPLGSATLDVDDESGEVTLEWSAIEGGTYVAQRSTDLTEWQTLPGASLDADVLMASDHDGAPRKFYRAKLLDIAPFDDAGFDVQETLAQVSDASNNVLLIIVDDWGIDSMAGNPITPTLTIGGSTGTAVARPSRNVATATFTLPNTPGSYDAEAVFPGPNMPTFGLTFAFEVTP